MITTKHKFFWWLFGSLSTLFLIAVFSYLFSENNEVPVPQADIVHQETDLERREREEKKWGHMLFQYVEDLKQNALNPPSDEEITKKIREGLFSIDQYSGYIPEGKREPWEKSPDRPLGMGIVCIPDPDGARITDVWIKSPGERAGLRIGDIITDIVEGKEKISLVGLSQEALNKKMSEVTKETTHFAFLRNGKTRLERKLDPENMIEPVVDTVEWIAPHYGYLHIRFFTLGQAASEFAYALEHLGGRELHGLVINLRGTPGGDFNETLQMLGTLLPPGALITTTVSRAEGRKPYYATGGDVLEGVPIIILVDRNTASASELVVGALVDRDSPRAILMGEQTYGKGVGQTVIPVAGGGRRKITGFEFFTPRGNVVNKKGFAPDPTLLGKYRESGVECVDALRCSALNYLKELHELAKRQK